jgi:glutamate-1-semialdehyde 2,1-aminomutase
MLTAMVPQSASTGLLGGISSGFRVNPYTGGHLEVDRVHGPYIETVDGRTFIDMFMAHGSAILGHAEPRLFTAIARALQKGVVGGYETGEAARVADRLGQIIPSAEAVRFVASGSEAVLTAVRLARAFTGRQVIIKIDGQFNGGNDYVLYNSMAVNCDPTNPGGRVSALKPFSSGVPHSVEPSMRLVPWNDLPAIEAAYADAAGDVAAILMVPIDYNNGCLVAGDGYLAAVRDLAHARGSLLIFDEVLSGFKTGLSCAQGLYGITPDLTTLSKALSNGVPFSALMGTSEVMSVLSVPLPKGALQGGTYAGSPIGAAAANATLDILEEPQFYPGLFARTDRFLRALQEMFDQSPVPARVQWLGCGFGIYIGTREPVVNAPDVQRLDPEPARTYFRRCIDRGIYFHTDFTVSAAHTDAVLDIVLDRMADAASQPL